MGVSEGTCVSGAQGRHLVQELAPGDQISSYDCESGQWLTTVVRRVVVRPVKANMAYLQVRGTELGLEACQLVWAERRAANTGDQSVSMPQSWVEAQNLIPGDRVFSLAGSLQVELNAVVEMAEVRLVELETESRHCYAVGDLGVLVHNRIPPLTDGQTHVLTVQATGGSHQLTLPPIDQQHIFQGFLDPAIPILHGLHYLAGQPAIQKNAPVDVAGHVMRVADPAGGWMPQIVTLRVIPEISVTGDAPFAARVEVFDPATKALLVTKKRATFFPANWTPDQVLQAVYEATCNYVVAKEISPVGRGLRGATDGGVALLLHIDAAAGAPRLICSGYPDGPQPLVTAAQAPQ